jgi:hypothetical protein
VSSFFFLTGAGRTIFVFAALAVVHLVLRIVYRFAKNDVLVIVLEEMKKMWTYSIYLMAADWLFI